jgi:hypothetical protein
LVGRGFWDGVSVVAVRGLNTWTVWWKGPPGKGFDAGTMPSATQPFAKNLNAAASAAWTHGGHVRTADASETVALWVCRVEPCADASASSWERVTPFMDGASRPFDAAARLDLEALAKPDAGNLQNRIGTLFAEWLPCHTRAPSSDRDIGEDTVAAAALMMSARLPARLPE